jgi:hypothetical protein
MSLGEIMKLLIVAALILVSFASAHSVFSHPQTEKEIQSIRRSYSQTNRNQARYRKVKKELAGFSAEGGELTAYFNGDTIVKIAATYYGETGRTSEDYYYQDGKLIFVLRKESRYNRPLTGKVISTKLNRFYFHDDKLIRWIDETGKQAPSNTPEYLEQEKDYLQTSKLFTDGARSPASLIESP